jgi:hypothetical protein
MEADCSIAYVRQQREKHAGRVKDHLKTESGCRDVEFPDAAAILRKFIGGRKNGFLFRTANGSMLDPGNVASDSLRPILEEMGVAQGGTTTGWGRRHRILEYRQDQVKKVGQGFERPPVLFGAT